VFNLPVALLPVIRIIVLAELLNTISQLAGFQQEQLNYEKADLSLVTLVRSQSQAKHNPIDGHNVELPDHVVNGVDALVNKVAAIR